MLSSSTSLRSIHKRQRQRHSMGFYFTSPSHSLLVVGYCKDKMRKVKEIRPPILNKIDDWAGKLFETALQS
ncbi:CLUMA_CG011011, isoform A [Clunio marinus]|uniref:CLUMA_CG011011, isoform A n=1 Tax=Clunio marinus TaxID=568069 RepID=A0A1J1IGQ2_9DIPT|nr:CLUMA_CG011011, isoform A [Clunio marinus]